MRWPVAASILLLASTALADEPPARKWYGWQIAVSDAAAISSIAAGLMSDDRDVALAGAGLFVLAPPVLHAAHGNSGYGAASFSLRLGAPVAGLTLGYLLLGATGSGDFAEVNGAAMGLIIGSATALGVSILDIVVLAHERRKISGLTLAPRVTPTSAALSLGGSF
jgi:hypothetical protein